MDISTDDLDFDQAENDTLLAENLQTEIAQLKSKLNYHPALRIGLVGGVLGNYFGGWKGAIGGVLLGGLLGSKIVQNDVDNQVIINQIHAKQRELAEIVKRGNLNDAELNGIMTSEDLAEYQYDVYEFTDEWEELFGEPAKAFHLMVFGRPKQGKSIFCVKFSNYIQRFGKVLYVAAEEGFSKTLQNKVNDFGMASKNLDFANFRDFEGLQRALELNSYSFVVLDSVNFMKLGPEEIEQLKKENPHTAFITIQQATKDGQFRGSQEFAHNCDMIVQVEAGIAYQQGRFKEPSEMKIFEDAEPMSEDASPSMGAEKPKRKSRKKAQKESVPDLESDLDAYSNEQDF